MDEKKQVIIMEDIGKLKEKVIEKIKRWIEKGGKMVRFEGKRIEGEREKDKIMKVKLRKGESEIGGKIQWQEKKKMRELKDKRKFEGMEIKKEVKVKSKVMEEN